jgi:hypothetical protein
MRIHLDLLKYLLLIFQAGIDEISPRLAKVPTVDIPSGIDNYIMRFHLDLLEYLLLIFQAGKEFDVCKIYILIVSYDDV